MPAVSVIVPNYNHARFLRERIESILGQTVQDFELILLDDASTDESREILREYGSDSRVHLEFNEENSGSTFKQWNKGVEMARGQYVWIAESDDYADPKFLQRLMALLDRGPDVAFTYCRSWRVDEEGRLDGFGDDYVVFWDSRTPTKDFCMEGREVCREYLCVTNVIPNASAVVFRKDAYDQVGGADETLRLCGDWKLWAAMALEGKVAYLSEPLNYFRFHRASMRHQSSVTNSDLFEMFDVCRWVLGRVGRPRPDVIRRMSRQHAHIWVPALLSRRVSRQTKGEIMRHVRSFYPHPLWTAARFLPKWAAVKVPEGIAQIWYPILALTYKARHAVGLHRGGLAQLKARLWSVKTGERRPTRKDAQNSLHSDN